MKPDIQVQNIGSTTKKEDGQPHLIVLSHQTQSLKRETTG